ncbi:hypothetical protein AB0D11_20115 [Streptomyces monashensis]|uniref:hypothetical protein n=1 Tax=Streptomyces monashensis TaxID=1678012 RepID=UPI0033F112F1
MNTLDKLNVLLLIGAAVLLAMACVKADRLRAWRESINPSAPEVPDSAFAVARVVLVTMAGIGFFTAVRGFGVSDGMSWNDHELTSAVQQATDDLDGYRFTADDSGTSAYFADYASLLEEKVTRYGGADAPASGVTTTPSAADTDDDANLTVTADGADASFCTHIERGRSPKDDYTPPGIGGGEGALTYRGYRLMVTTRSGEC